jgi:hypothetical protein
VKAEEAVADSLGEAGLSAASTGDSVERAGLFAESTRTSSGIGTTTARRGTAARKTATVPRGITARTPMTPSTARTMLPRPLRSGAPGRSRGTGSLKRWGVELLIR